MSPYRKLAPMPHEKTERNRKLFTYHLKHPEATYAILGNRFNISTSRAFQIVKRMDKG